MSQNAGAAKSQEIMRLFNIVPLDPRWSLPSRLADNRLAWLIPLKGEIVDVRMMPCELQDRAYQLGRIPIVPTAGEDNGGPTTGRFEDDLDLLDPWSSHA